MANKDVETKVVQMRFDNQKFERKINATINSVNALDDSLQFKGSREGLQELSKTLDKLETSELNKDLKNTDSIIHKISVSFKELLKIKLLSKAIDTVTRSAMGLFRTITGFNNVLGGWEAYNESLTTVGGILNQIHDEENGLTRVANAMDQLRWYADETSYSFQTMSDGIRQFTIAGIELEAATSAVQGVANLAGSAKVFDPFKVQSAMDAISKSMQTGYMDVMKWTSLTNTAGVVTQDFSKMLLEAAAAQGTLIKSAGGQYKTKKGGMLVTPENIRETLSKRWLTKDVLTTVLGQYNSATETVQSFMNAVGEGSAEAWEVANKYFAKTGKTYKNLDEVISEVQNNPERYSEQVVKMTENMNEDNLTTRQAIILMKELGVEFDEISYKAFLSSQETTSFSQAVTYASGAIKTSWQGIFQSIFGDVEKATELWSEVSDKFYDIFVAPFNALEDKVGVWSKLENGGAADFRNTLLTLIDVFGEFKQAITSGFRSVFSDDIVGFLQKVTLKLKDFADNLKNNKEVLNTFANIGIIIGNILKVISKIGTTIFRLAGRIIAAITPSLETVSTVLVDITDVIAELIETLIDSGVIDFIGNVVVNVIKLLTTALKNLVKVFKGESIDDIADSFSEDGKKLFESLKGIATSLIGFLGSVLQLASAGLGTLLTGLGNIIEWFAKRFADGSITLAKAVTIFITAIMAIKIFGILRRIFDISRILHAISDMLWVPYEWVLSKKLKAIGLMVLEIAAAVLLISIAIEKISNISVPNLIKSLIAVGLILGTLMWFMIYVSNKTKVKHKEAASRFVAIGLAILLIATSIMIIFNTVSKMSMGDILKSSITLLALFGGIMLIVTGYNKLNSKIKGKSQSPKLFGTLVGISTVLLAMSVLFLMVAKLDWGDIAKGIVTIIVVFGLVGALIAIMNKTANGKKSNRIGRSIFAISLSLLILSSVMKILSTMTGPEIGKSLGIIAALSIFLVGMIFLIKLITKNLETDRMKSLQKTIKTLRTIAFSLLIMSISLLILKSVGWKEIGKAFVIIGGMFIIIFGLGKLLSKANNFGKGFGKIIAMLLVISLDLLILAGALTILSFVPWAAIGKALSMILGIITISLIALKIIDKINVPFKSIFKLITLLGSISIALVILSAGLLILSASKWDNIGKAMGLITGVLIIILAVIKIFDKINIGWKTIFKFMTTISFFVIALFFMSLVLSDYVGLLIRVAKIADETSMDTVIQSMIVLMGGLVVLALSMAVISEIVNKTSKKGFFLSIIILGTAIAALWGFTKIIENIAKYDDNTVMAAVKIILIISGLVTAIALVFSIIGKIFKKDALIGVGVFALTLLSLAGAFALFGLIMNYFEDGIEFFKLLFDFLGNMDMEKAKSIILAFGAVMLTLVLTIAMLGALGAASGIGFIGVAVLALILLTLVGVFAIFVAVLNHSKTDIGEFADFFERVGNTIAEVVERILGAIGDLIVKIIDALSGAIHQANEDLVLLLNTLKEMDEADINKLFRLAAGLTALGAALVLESGEGLFASIANWFSGGDPLTKVVNSLNAFDENKLGLFNKFIELLQSLPESMKGINNNLDPYKNAISQMFKPIEDLAFKIASNGNGIEAIRNLFKDLFTFDTFGIVLAIQYIDKIQHLLDSDFDMHPTITPVFDFSQFDAGISRMRTSFGTIQSYYSAQAAQGEFNASRSNGAINNRVVFDTAMGGIPMPGISMNVTQNFNDGTMYSYQATRSTQNMIESAFRGVQNGMKYVGNSVVGLFKRK